MDCIKCFIYNETKLQVKFSEGLGKALCVHNNDGDLITDIQILTDLEEQFRGVYTGLATITEDINCLSYYCCEECNTETPYGSVAISELSSNPSNVNYGFFSSVLDLKGIDTNPLSSGNQVRLVFSAMGVNYDVIFNVGDDVTTATPIDNIGNWGDIQPYFNSGIIQDGGDLIFNKRQFSIDNNLIDNNSVEIKLDVFAIEDGVYSANVDNDNLYTKDTTLDYSALFTEMGSGGTGIGGSRVIIGGEDRRFILRESNVVPNDLSYWYSTDSTSIGLNSDENASAWLQIPYLTFPTIPSQLLIAPNSGLQTANLYSRIDSSYGDIGNTRNVNRNNSGDPRGYYEIRPRIGVEHIEKNGDFINVRTTYSRFGNFHNTRTATSITMKLIQGGLIANPTPLRTGVSDYLQLSGETVLNTVAIPNSDFVHGNKDYLNAFDISSLNHGNYGVHMILESPGGYKSEFVSRFNLTEW